MSSPNLEKKRRRLDQTALSVTRWVGSPASVIIHTIIFIGAFSLTRLGFVFDTVLLVLTTIVSLEAIYLAIFIQMTINLTTAQLEGVEQDIEEISEDVEDIREGVEDMSIDVDDIREDVEEINEDELGEDKEAILLQKIENHVQKLAEEIQALKQKS